MKRTALSALWLVALVALVGVSSTPAAATPAPNGAAVKTRIFNDCPTSVLTVTNSYPASVKIDDTVLDCGGFANLHNWRFSEDGGATAAVFNNDANFRYGCDLVMSGTSEGEGGLQVAPWWSQDVDGRFNVRTTDGEIACFGGRLPFYSFTGSHAINYVKGTTIHLEIEYRPNGLNVAAPATIEYFVTYNAINYSSGPLPFDQGNPAENPPYGVYGMLQDARVGGHFQPFLQGGNSAAGLSAEWSNITFQDLGPVSVETSSWGSLKALYR
jgi:hypothetical protein